MEKKTFNDMTFEEFCGVAAKEGITNRVKLEALFRDRPKDVNAPLYDEDKLRQTFREYKEVLA